MSVRYKHTQAFAWQAAAEWKRARTLQVTSVPFFIRRRRALYPLTVLPVAVSYTTPAIWVVKGSPYMSRSRALLLSAIVLVNLALLAGQQEARRYV